MQVESRHPVPGVDYPRTLVEFEEWFSSEETCLQFLCRLRWRYGFRCPGCGGEKTWSTIRGELRCASCQRQTSLTSGTIFQGTTYTKPLLLWFRAMWHITNQKFGASALGLQRTLGFGSYQTAWVWLQKMRRAMVRSGREKLSGLVEVDETYVGSLEEGVRGRHTEKKTIVAIAVEIHVPKRFDWGTSLMSAHKALCSSFRKPLSQALLCTPTAGKDTLISTSGAMFARRLSFRPVQNQPTL